jgi:nitronate monooxygenase
VGVCFSLCFSLLFPLQSFFTAPLKQAAAKMQTTEYSSLYAGQGAPLLKHKKAALLMKSLIDELSR